MNKINLSQDKERLYSKKILDYYNQNLYNNKINSRKFKHLKPKFKHHNLESQL